MSTPLMSTENSPLGVAGVVSLVEAASEREAAGSLLTQPGEFRFDRVLRGAHQLRVRCRACAPTSAPVMVEAGATVDLGLIEVPLKGSMP